eukprot:CAMPEP_0183703034 /NCGR_PEP_ID=MMETSP0737-20130205/930_1 /TAXON_ID=385413 /ORGANISM="Thalassiosira miniscula, Strain CCMP1093" /LENGTH=216 /DNA_ID=CAMNT_0025929731 /DNA_START=29 /DNA_END=679 /DNA_ORIENTATION=+
MAANAIAPSIRRLCLLLAALSFSNGIEGTSVFALHKINIRRTGSASPLCMVVEIGPTDDDVDPPLPGQMKISEIKSELDLRKVSHSDCFDRESLELRLIDARSSGRADPSIIDEFNRRNLEANVKGESFEVSDDMIEETVGGDGTLPGGMPPDMLKEMMGNEDLVTMMRSPKMQEIMKLVMSGGPEDLEQAMKDDPETYECVQKLNQIMGGMNKVD